MLDRRLLIVSGKGGVGKSAVTASLALLAARRGAGVLCIAMTDAVGLAVHLGVEDLGYEPRRVRAGVDAMVVNRPRALDEYLRLQLRIPRAAPLGQFTRLFQVLIDTAPGVREIVSMGKPIHEVWRGRYDLVIVDAPPIGQLISYLRAPATIAELVPAGVVQEQAIRMRTTLTDPQTSGLLVVTMAEELPVAETIDALREMGTEALIDIVGIAVNRVVRPLHVAAGVIDRLPDGPTRQAAVLHQRIAAEQESWLHLLPAGPRLPHLFGVLTPGEVAAALADRWEAT
jgi:anion-transporting  ArsA/GET3 family ATPase